MPVSKRAGFAVRRGNGKERDADEPHRPSKSELLAGARGKNVSFPLPMAQDWQGLTIP